MYLYLLRIIIFFLFFKSIIYNCINSFLYIYTTSSFPSVCIHFIKLKCRSLYNKFNYTNIRFIIQLVYLFTCCEGIFFSDVNTVMCREGKSKVLRWVIVDVWMQLLVDTILRSIQKLAT